MKHSNRKYYIVILVTQFSVIHKDLYCYDSHCK